MWEPRPEREKIMIGFLIGLFVGAFFGFIFAGILAMARDSDEYARGMENCMDLRSDELSKGDPGRVVVRS